MSSQLQQMHWHLIVQVKMRLLSSGTLIILLRQIQEYLIDGFLRDKFETYFTDV